MYRTWWVKGECPLLRLLLSVSVIATFIASKVAGVILLDVCSEPSTMVPFITALYKLLSCAR